MKNFFLLLVLIPLFGFSQDVVVSTSKVYFILNEKTREWSVPHFKKTKFELYGDKIILYQDNANIIYKIISSDEEANTDKNGEEVYRMVCQDIKKQRIEIVFVKTKEKERLIHFLEEKMYYMFELD